MRVFRTKSKFPSIPGVVALAVVAALALAVGLMSQQSAEADLNHEQVPTRAEVTSNNTPPVIECKWELPDMQPGIVGNEFPEAEKQYGTVSNAHQHDDDMATGPDVSPACGGPPDTLPTQPDGVRSMIQVRPMPDDQPEERRVQLWMAVDHPNGISNISDVFWKVFHPDGSFKVQVHGTKVEPADCASLGSSTETGKMFESAVHTGQVSAAAVDDLNKGLVAKCQQSEKAIYYAQFSISKEQPCGEYRVEASAVASGAETVLTNYIDVTCFYFMQTDFCDVDWGTVTPGLTDIVSGDLLWNPECDTAPTVRNVGNHGMGLSINFDQMVQVGPDGLPIPGGKTIDDFDACFGKTPATIQCIDPIPASVTVPFDNDPARVLCSNEDGKLDLSIHPPSTLPAGDYAGGVDLWARAVHDICPTDQEVHG